MTSQSASSVIDAGRRVLFKNCQSFCKSCQKIFRGYCFFLPHPVGKKLLARRVQPEAVAESQEQRHHVAAPTLHLARRRRLRRTRRRPGRSVPRRLRLVTEHRQRGLRGPGTVLVLPARRGADHLRAGHRETGAQDQGRWCVPWRNFLIFLIIQFRAMSKRKLPPQVISFRVHCGISRW